MGAVLDPVLTIPISAVSVLFATVRARLGPFRPVKTAPAPLEAVLMGQNGPGRARTVADRAETALTGAVRTGLYFHGAGADSRTARLLMSIWLCRYNCRADVMK